MKTLLLWIILYQCKTISYNAKQSDKMTVDN